jgi:hypothetical protein
VNLCWTALQRALDDAYGRTVPGCPPLSAECLRVTVEAEDRFLPLVTPPEPTISSGEFQYRNLPHARVSLGVLAAAILEGGQASDRFKVEEGEFVADPLVGTTLAAGIVNFHPLPYDPAAPGMTRREAFRFFGGVAITPAFGPIVGAGLSPLRGLSFNAGIAWLLTEHAVRDPENPDAPADAKNPFALKFKRVYFIGLAYSFGA